MMMPSVLVNCLSSIQLPRTASILLKIHKNYLLEIVALSHVIICCTGLFSFKGNALSAKAAFYPVLHY